MPTKRYYFDWAAAAIPDIPPEPGNSAGADTLFGNPSSPYTEGREARSALEKARARCAAVLGVPAEELFFTSGGTESNAIVLFSLLRRLRGLSHSGEGAEKAGAELLFSAAEHPSVRENCAVLRGLGINAAAIPVDGEGRVTEAALTRILKKNPRPKMAAVMAVNNETGTINDMAALAAALRAGDGPPAHLHCDLVQAAGKIPLDIAAWGIDSAALSGHKLGAPRGIGLLWLKKPLLPLIQGGGQERLVRPGTENTSGALALARALEAHAAPAALACGAAAQRMDALAAELEKSGRFIPIPETRPFPALSAAGGAGGTGSTSGGFSPWILQAAFRGRHGIIPGETLVRALDERGFAVSTGSACSSADRERPVLKAMGIDHAAAFGGIRISQGWSTTIEDIRALAKVLAELCGEL